MPKRIYVGNLPFDVTHEEINGHIRATGAGGGAAPVVEELKRNKAADAARASLVVEGGKPNAIAAAIDGTVLRGKRVVCSTDRQVVVNHEEQDM